MVSLSSCSKQNILNYFLNLEESEIVINLSFEVEKSKTRSGIHQ